MKRRQFTLTSLGTALAGILGVKGAPSIAKKAGKIPVLVPEAGGPFFYLETMFPVRMTYREHPGFFRRLFGHKRLEEVHPYVCEDGVTSINPEYEDAPYQVEFRIPQNIASSVTPIEPILVPRNGADYKMVFCTKVQQEHALKK